MYSFLVTKTESLTIFCLKKSFLDCPNSSRREMGKGKPKSKGTKLQLGEFLGDNAGNTVNIGGKTVEMPSAPKAATLEIDITKVPNRTLVHF